MAYALMGFHQNQRPDVKMIKLRYKQLSKIYHPDLHGSEEEMKRLNSAVKSWSIQLINRYRNKHNIWKFRLKAWKISLCAIDLLLIHNYK